MSHQLSAGILSILRPTSFETISALVLPCETAVCFLKDHEAGTYVWLPIMHDTPLDVDLDSARSPAKPAS